MSTKITNMTEYENFTAPNKRVKMIEVFYESDKGYKGSVSLEKDGATKDSITKAVMNAASLSEEMLGLKIGK